MAFGGLAGTPLFSSICLLEIGRKDEQCLLRNDHLERRLLTGSAIKTCQDSFPCASWHSVEIRERETGRCFFFLKRERESGREIGQRFLKTGIREMRGGKIFEWIDG